MCLVPVYIKCHTFAFFGCRQCQLLPQQINPIVRACPIVNASASQPITCAYCSNLLSPSLLTLSSLYIFVSKKKVRNCQKKLPHNFITVTLRRILQAQVGDIGLMGGPAKLDGKAVEGVRIFLGGTIGENPKVCNWLC